MIALLRRLDPILYVDCHVSDGFDMQHDIAYTYTYAGWGCYAYHRATADWLMTPFGPRVTSALEKAGHLPRERQTVLLACAPEKDRSFRRRRRKDCDLSVRFRRAKSVIRRVNSLPCADNAGS
jgi:hypothetical protein